MNKKLKIYSGMLIAAILVFLLTKVVHYNESNWYKTYDNEELSLVYELPSEFHAIDSINGERHENTFSMYNIEVSVEPKREPSTPIMVSQAGEQMSTIRMQKVIVSMPSDKITTGSIVPYAIALIISSVIFVWILYLVYKLIRSIRRGEFFNTQFSKTLEIVGILFSVSYIIQVAFEYIIITILAHEIDIAHYHIVFNNDIDPFILFMGLTLMTISQIVLIAKDIKEEQDLTI